MQRIAEPLAATSRDAQLYRALDHPHLQPARQEAPAAALNLPSSTFRRQLKQGIERVTAQLRAHEIGVGGSERAHANSERGAAS